MAGDGGKSVPPRTELRERSVDGSPGVNPASQREGRRNPTKLREKALREDEARDGQPVPKVKELE